MNFEVLGINLILFLLVLVRWAGFIMLAPILGGRAVPVYIKLALSISLAAVVYPIIAAGHTPPADPFNYAMLMLRETMIGLCMGFISQQILFILQGAGHIIDTQLGFSMGNLIDPINSAPAPLTGNFKVILATMLLLSTNAHHYLIAALVRSYDYVQLLGGGSSPTLSQFGVNFLTATFVGAVRIALPVAGVLLLTEIALGFAARALPQMNVFMLGFPLKIGLGFLLMLWLVPYMGTQVENLFQDSLNQMHLFLAEWGKP